MNEREQRIAIAEACGIPAGQINAWLDQVQATSDMQCAVPGGEERYRDKVLRAPDMSPPDYLHDLNAMHEAEKTLKIGHDGSPAAEYQEALWNVSNRGVTFCAENLHDVAYLQNLICATAAQRAEAFLHAIGKWRDATPAYDPASEPGDSVDVRGGG